MIAQESLVALAAAEIRSLVVKGELAPGDRLHEPPLAERLGISRPPLREALRMLESEGLLEQQPRRGYRVVVMTEADIEEIYTLRRALETLALDLLLVDHDPAKFDPLEPIIEKMRTAAEAGDSSEVVQTNVDFHLGVVAATGHKRLERSYRSLMVQMQLCMAANVVTEAESVGALGRGYERHKVLFDSLRTGDREKILHDFQEHGERDYLGRATGRAR